MADDTLRLIAAIEANTKQFENALKKVEKHIGNIEGHAKKFGDTADRSFKRVESSVDSAAKKIGNFERITRQLSKAFVAIYAVDTLARFAQQVAKVTDDWTKMGNRLQAAGYEIGVINSLQSELVDIAMRTRMEYQTIGETFSRLTMVAKPLGYTTQQILTVTEGIGAAFQSAGLGVIEASNATRQLLQGIGSGRLAGDELRAVLEQAPPIAAALAREFGVSVGELKELGAEGKLTTIPVMKALAENAASWGSLLNNQTVTIEQGMTNLNTAVAELYNLLVRDLPSGGGFLNSVANLFNEWSDNIRAAEQATKDYDNEVTRTILNHQQLYLETGRNLSEFINKLQEQGVATEEAAQAWAILNEHLGDRTAYDIATSGLSAFEDHLVSVTQTASETTLAIRALSAQMSNLPALGNVQDLTQVDAALQAAGLPAQQRFEEGYEFTAPKPLRGGGGGSSGGGGTKKKSIDDIVQELKDEAFALNLSTEAQRAYNLAKQNGIEWGSQHADIILREVENNERLKTTMEQYKDSVQAANDFFTDQFSSTIDNLIDGNANLADSFRDVAKSIAKAVVQAALFGKGNLGGLFGGGLFSGGFNLFGQGGMFPLPARANGGSVSPQRPYMVGERGREMFIPQTAGKIVPNNQLVGGGTVVNVINNTGESVQKKQSKQPDGRELVELIIGTVSQATVQGRFDSANGAAYGLSPKGFGR